MLIHDQTPPGAPVMQKLKDEITYDFEEIDRGAAVRISNKRGQDRGCVGRSVSFTQRRKDRKDAKAGQMLRARQKHLARLCVFAIFAPLREIPV